MKDAIQTVLVTGATGFLGRAVVDALLAGGRAVVGTWKSAAPSRVAAGLTWIEAGSELPAFDAVCHLAAALPSGAGSEEAAARVNRALDESAFALAADRAVPLVYASGTLVYGHSTSERALDESAPLSPPGPYLAEKAWAEERGRTLLGPKFTALRICAPYGPGQAARSVLPLFVARALRGERLTYHGTGAREQTFTHARDVADAFVRALSGPSGTYNIAGPAPVTMRALALAIARHAGLEESQVAASGQPDAQEHVRARFDTGRARERLAWRPTVALEDGLAQCVKVVAA